MAGEESFNPATRQDWVDLFRDGILSANAAEAEAKAKAEQQEREQKEAEEKEQRESGSGKPRSFADRLLGNK